MKQTFTALIATVILFACNNEKKTDEIKSEEKTASASIAYAYTADYSSDFSIGDANYSKMVLDLYKMWEENKIDEMKTLLADSVMIEFPDGNKLADMPVDSMLNIARQVRKGMSSLKIQFDGWIPVRSNDKQADYVLAWTRDYVTDLAGKTDSSRVHAYFLIKNNKIRSWSEFEQKLTPPAPGKK